MQRPGDDTLPTMPRPPFRKRPPQPSTAADSVEADAPARVLYGIHAVTEHLRARPRDLRLICFARAHAHGHGDGPLAGLRSEALRLGVPTAERSRSELDGLAGGGVHQGVVALSGAYRYASSVGELLERATGAPLFLILDGVTDPQNLGALVRSAYVLGAHGVVIPKDRAASVTPAAVKAAAGATELLPIAQATNLVRSLDELREAGVWLAAAVAPGQGGVPPWRCDLTQPIGLLLGSEGAGLRPLVRKSADLRIEIPMAEGLHGASLNVSTAGAVLLYEAARQRRLAAATQQATPPDEPAELDELDEHAELDEQAEFDERAEA